MAGGFLQVRAATRPDFRIGPSPMKGSGSWFVPSTTRNWWVSGLGPLPAENAGSLRGLLPRFPVARDRAITVGPALIEMPKMPAIRMALLEAALDPREPTAPLSRFAGADSRFENPSATFWSGWPGCRSRVRSRRPRRRRNDAGRSVGGATLGTTQSGSGFLRPRIRPRPSNGINRHRINIDPGLTCRTTSGWRSGQRCGAAFPARPGVAPRAALSPGAYPTPGGPSRRQTPDREKSLHGSSRPSRIWFGSKGRRECPPP